MGEETADYYRAQWHKALAQNRLLQEALKKIRNRHDDDLRVARPTSYDRRTYELADQALREPNR